MKILNLTEAVKVEVKSHQQQISDALAELLKGNQTLNKLTQRQRALTEEVATLEDASPDNKKAIATLSEKRTELELVSRRLAEIPPPDQAAEGPLRNLLYEASKLIPRVLKTTYEGYVAEITKGLRPFCISDGWALGIAWKTQASIDLGGVIHRDYGRYGGVIGNAQEVLKRYDQILAADFIWEFDPKMS